MFLPALVYVGVCPGRNHWTVLSVCTFLNGCYSSQTLYRKASNLHISVFYYLEQITCDTTVAVPTTTSSSKLEGIPMIL